MDFLKKSSSMVDELIALRAGSMRRSLPNLEGCVGYAVEIYLLRASCAWSCNVVIVEMSWMVLCSPFTFSTATKSKKCDCQAHVGRAISSKSLKDKRANKVLIYCLNFESLKKLKNEDETSMKRNHLLKSTWLLDANN